MYSYETLSEALADLKSRGYTEDFNINASSVECRALDIHFHPEDFMVDEYYRFEGASDPDDSSIVYAISSKTGVKGTLVDAYGMYSDNLNEQMIEKLRVIEG